MTRLFITLATIIGISFFPLLTRIVSPEAAINSFKQWSAPENITKINDRIVDEAVIDFNEWQDSMGIFHDGIEIKFVAPGIRGVYATRDLKPGEVIMRIPENAMIPEDFKTNDPVILRARKEYERHSMLAVILYREMNNPKSRFKPYFNLLPKDLSNFPQFFSPKVFKLIEGTAHFGYFYNVIHNMKLHYSEFLKLFPELSKVTEQEYIKAFTYSASRSLGVTINGRFQIAIIPMFDLFNAYPYTKEDMEGAIVKVDKNPDGTASVVATTKKKIKAGEEIYFSYRKDETNSEIMTNYGFIFPEINDVCLFIPIEYPQNDPNLGLKKELLSLFPNNVMVEAYAILHVSNSSNEDTYIQLYSGARILELLVR